MANESGGSRLSWLYGLMLGVSGFALLIFLLYRLLTSGSGLDPASPAMTDEAIAARLQTVGQVKVVAGGPPGSRSGKTVYESVCFSCHATGAINSPKFADTVLWAPRLAKGYEALVKSALGGFNAMPARGGAADLTDDEVRRAVAFMGNAAGAKFVEPKVVALAIDPQVKGKEIYQTVCFACHAAGLLNSPKFGDKAAWAPRLKDGVENALVIATKGLNAMPPKGGYSGSDEEFRAAVLYMINSSK